MSEALVKIPLFPLSSVVMPGGLLPLRLFERRYIDMVSSSLRHESGFGVCLIRDGQESGAPAEPYPVGTLVSIVDFDQGSDGLLHITAEGRQEFRVQHYEANEGGLLIGDVALAAAKPPTPMTPEFEELATKLELILTYVEPDVRYREKQLDDADWVCYRLLELLPLVGEAKYDLLQMDSNTERLRSLAALQIQIAERGG